MQVPVINLGSVKEDQDLIEINDFNHKWIYQRIIKPFDMGKTKYWNLFHIRKLTGKKDNKEIEDVRIMSGILSPNYTIVRTEDIIESIHKNVGGTIKIGRVNVTGSDILVTFTLDSFVINDIVEEETAKKILFKLITDIDVEELMNKSILSFTVINSMSGNKKVSLNYGLLITYYTKNQNIKPLSINNSYVLSEYSTSLVHGQKLDISYHNIQNVKNQVKDKIEDMKSYPVTDEFVAFITSKLLRVSLRDEIRNKWENLPTEYKNLYYLTLISSYCQWKSGSVDADVHLRRLILAEYRKMKKGNSKVVNM